MARRSARTEFTANLGEGAASDHESRYHVLALPGPLPPRSLRPVRPPGSICEAIGTVLS